MAAMSRGSTHGISASSGRVVVSRPARSPPRSISRLVINKPQPRMQQRGAGLLARGAKTLLDPGQAVDEAQAVARLGADTALEHHARDPVLPHRRDQALPDTFGRTLCGPTPGAKPRAGAWTAGAPALPA